MDNLTEEQWKKIIKKEGCAFKPLWQVRGEYANLSPYMRVYISLLAKKEVFDDIEKKAKYYCMNYFLSEVFEPIKKRHLLTQNF